MSSFGSFPEVNFGHFDISKTLTSERPKNRKKKLKQKKIETKIGNMKSVIGLRTILLKFYIFVRSSVYLCHISSGEADTGK